jgi:hypothetical protein
MLIEVTVKKSELVEMNTDRAGLTQLITTDLITSDIDNDYPGFIVVIHVEEDK